MIELETRPAETPVIEVRPKTPQETLLAAARYIEEHGWKQGGLGEDGGPRCVMGAILSVADTDYGRGFLANPLHLLDRASFGNCIQFNDQPGRTEADVIAALRKAATL